jgi:hypothetical protein
MGRMARISQYRISAAEDAKALIRTTLDEVSSFGKRRKPRQRQDEIDERSNMGNT